jgi:hypothetical protein
MPLIQEAVRIAERLDEQNDDHLADFIKTLTQDDVRWLWLTVLENRPCRLIPDVFRLALSGKEKPVEPALGRGSTFEGG